MVNERTRTEVWQGLWDAHRVAHDYQAAHRRYQFYNAVCICALIVFGAAALVATWERIPDVVLPVAGLLVAGIALWTLFANYAAKSAVAHALSGQCADLAIEWSTLSARLESADEDIDEPLARKHLDDLKRRMLTLKQRQTARQRAGNNHDRRSDGKLCMKDVHKSSTKPSRPPGSKPPPPPPPPRRQTAPRHGATVPGRGTTAEQAGMTPTPRQCCVGVYRAFNGRSNAPPAAFSMLMVKLSPLRV